MTTTCYALVPCAGVGARAGVGGPKQYHSLAGRAVVAHTLDALSRVPRIATTLVTSEGRSLKRAIVLIAPQVPRGIVVPRGTGYLFTRRINS